MSKEPAYLLVRLEVKFQGIELPDWPDELMLRWTPTGTTEVREIYENRQTGETEVLEWWTRDKHMSLPHMQKILDAVLTAPGGGAPMTAGQFYRGGR